MKFAVVVFLLLCSMFSGCLESRRVGEIAVLADNSAPIVPEMVSAAEFRSRPDIILQAYVDAYPDIIGDRIFDGDDWALILHDGTRYYWANGRILPAEKKDQWQNFRSQQIYPYRGLARNPDSYTPERIEALRHMGSREVRSAPQLPLEGSFLRSLFGIGNRAETESHIVKTTLFGKRVNVNEAIVPKLALVDSQVNELARTDRSAADFLANLADVGGYSWRTVAGTNRNSNHSYGLALDILPKNWKNKAMYWDWVNDYNDDWMLLPQSKLWTPPESVVQIFKNNGFIWGGTWDIYDTMHFEYRPELIELSKKITF